MTTTTRNGLAIGDYILYETDDGMFREAVINGIVSEDEVSIIFTIKGQPTNRGLPRVNVEWCEKHNPET